MHVQPAMAYGNSACFASLVPFGTSSLHRLDDCGSLVHDGHGNADLDRITCACDATMIQEHVPSEQGGWQQKAGTPAGACEASHAIAALQRLRGAMGSADVTRWLLKPPERTQNSCVAELLSARCAGMQRCSSWHINTDALVAHRPRQQMQHQAAS